MMEGLRDLAILPPCHGVAIPYEIVIGRWGMGCLELVQAMTRCALLSEMLLATKPTKDYPGVYDYHVSSSFGEWFGREVAMERIPTDEAAARYFLGLVVEFFSQGEKSQETLRVMQERFDEVLRAFLGNA
jgi:hypothetical protein